MADSLAVDGLGLPPVPDAELDPYLDAAAKCFARHGLRRTKVVDIAEAVGVSRVTVYRQVGTIDHAARLLLARELDRLLSALLPRLLSASTPEEIIEVIVDATTFAIEHPVLAKVLRDEPDLVGGFIVTELDTLLDRLRLLANPVLERLASLGVTPPLDLGDLADWITRVLVTLVLSPPQGDVGEHLRGVLGPLLEWPSTRSQPRRRRVLRPAPS